MLMSPQNAANIHQAAEELLSKVRGALGDVDQFYRDQGFEPERVRSAIAACSTPEIVDEASTQFGQIWHEIEREVQTEAGLPPGGHVGKASRPPRPLV